MWKADEFAKSFDVTTVSRALHRYAGRVWSLSCMPQRSYLTGGYTAEISEHTGNGQFLANIALGNGKDPVAAALDGYRQARPTDPIWAAFDLELQVELLRRSIVSARATEKALERIVDMLTDAIRAA